MGTITYMPMTVGDTLQDVQDADRDALVVVFRERESQSWRVGWSKMELSDLLLAREYLNHCIRDVVAGAYQE